MKIALAEKGIPFTTRLPAAFGSGAVQDEEFKRDNPRHEVPTLVDGDLQVFDSTVILEYLEDKWPETPLLPRDPAERARLRMLEDVMDTQYEAINWGLLEIDGFKRASGALREQMLARAAKQSMALQAWLERTLAGRLVRRGALRLGRRGGGAASQHFGGARQCAAIGQQALRLAPARQ